MSKVINIHDARIRTVQVGIKAMTISDKQVTQSVFRQLLNEPLINHEGMLNGLPWGFVNYHPDKCGDSYVPHSHVVWQKGDELRRARINCKPAFEVFKSKALNRYASAVVRDMAIGRIASKTPECCREWQWGGIDVAATPVADALEIEKLWRDSYACIRDDHEQNKSTGEWEVVGTFYNLYRIDEIKAAIDRLMALPDLSTCRLLVNEEVAKEQSRRARWLKTTAEIAGLPQLFVAV